MKGDTEFGVEVFTPSQLKEKVDANLIDVGVVIEGPVFKSEFIDSIDTALVNAGGRIPLLMTPEYGYSTAAQRNDLYKHQTHRKTDSHNLTYVDTFYSGFQKEANEMGILLSEALIHPAPPDVLVSQWDEKIRAFILRDLDLVGYQATTELSMQYSYDTYDFEKSHTEHFLNIHREFYKLSGKSQDVLMVGKNFIYKQMAFVPIVDELIADGYTHISFCNVENGDEDVLYDTGAVGKKYRVIYVSDMSHRSMISCNALSGPLFGATGDQSLSEALSSNKFMVYECLSHKKALIDHYEVMMQELSHSDPDIISILFLLRRASSKIEYEQLGQLLRNPMIQLKLQRLNKALLEKFDFVAQLIEIDETCELAKGLQI